MLRSSLTMVPARREPYQAKLGMYLFMAGLVLVFFTALLGYAVVRSVASGPSIRLVLPSDFVGATLALIAVSVALHLAVSNIRRERHRHFRRWLAAAVAASALFFVLQVTGMTSLLSAHHATSPGEIRVFGFAFFLAGLHAVHVLGGFGLLGWVAVQGLRGVYDHERHWPVDICATYWHFLDGVWIVMLLTFWVVR